MRNVRYLCALLLIATAGCASRPLPEPAPSTTPTHSTVSQQQQWKLLVGRWYASEAMSDGARVEWIAEHEPHGEFVVLYRYHGKDGKVTHTSEIGEWGVSGPVYFSITKGWIRNGRFVPNDATDASSRDAYKIVVLNEQAFTYEHAASGHRTTVQRVSKLFDFERR